jgi:hypothetical protein
MESSCQINSITAMALGSTARYTICQGAMAWLTLDCETSFKPMIFPPIIQGLVHPRLWKRFCRATEAQQWPDWRQPSRQVRVEILFRRELARHHERLCCDMLTYINVDTHNMPTTRTKLLHTTNMTTVVVGSTTMCARAMQC